MILSRKNKGCHYPSGKVSLININTYFQLYSRLFPDGQQPNYLNFIFLISSGYVKFVRDISSNIKRYRRITFSRFECVKNIYGRTIFKQYWSDVFYVNRFSYSDIFSPDVPFYAPMPYRRQLHAIRVDPFVFKDYTNYFYILNCSVTPVWHQGNE